MLETLHQNFRFERIVWEVIGQPAVTGNPSSPGASPALAKVLRSAGSLALGQPLVVTVEPDGDIYIARTSALPDLYGTGDSVDAAKDSLGREIESLWNDLNEDEEFTEEWRDIRARLAQIIGDAK
jgi:hypothetical protein